MFKYCFLGVLEHRPVNLYQSYHFQKFHFSTHDFNGPTHKSPFSFYLSDFQVSIDLSTSIKSKTPTTCNLQLNTPCIPSNKNMCSQQILGNFDINYPTSFQENRGYFPPPTDVRRRTTGANPGISRKLCAAPAPAHTSHSSAGGGAGSWTGKGVLAQNRGR